MLKANTMVLSTQVIKGNEFLDVLSVLKVVVRNFFICFVFSEFIPYVFQVLALLLEVNPGGISETYLGLFQPLLQPVLWENSGNIPPLVRLLQAYISKGPANIPTDRLVSTCHCRLVHFL